MTTKYAKVVTALRLSLLNSCSTLQPLRTCSGWLPCFAYIWLCAARCWLLSSSSLLSPSGCCRWLSAVVWSLLAVVLRWCFGLACCQLYGCGLPAVLSVRCCQWLRGAVVGVASLLAVAVVWSGWWLLSAVGAGGCASCCGAAGACWLVLLSLAVGWGAFL